MFLKSETSLKSLILSKIPLLSGCLVIFFSLVTLSKSKLFSNSLKVRMFSLIGDFSYSLFINSAIVSFTASISALSLVEIHSSVSSIISVFSIGSAFTGISLIEFSVSFSDFKLSIYVDNKFKLFSTGILP